MQTFNARPPVFKIALKRKDRRGEGHLLPGNIGFGEQGCFQAFFADAKGAVHQFTYELQVDLVDFRQVIETDQIVNFHPGGGFFPYFPAGTIGDGLSIFEVTAGDVPQAVGRLDGTATEQDLILPNGQAPRHNVGVLVVDRLASRADKTLPVIPWRDLECNLTGAAVGTKLHGRLR